jgi:hypothetical protein
MKNSAFSSAVHSVTSVTVLGAIPASSDTVESEGRQMKKCLKVHKKQNKNHPVNLCSGNV